MMTNPVIINVGILGHVDSGKTSLVRALTTIASTASLDKHPQSKERGITLDLGFSAFHMPPKTLGNPNNDDRVKSPIDDNRLANLNSEDQSNYLICLVDCPGHASLIKTILNGAQIIDIVFLVIDATKGFQSQTLECLVISEIMSHQAIIVVNKIDQIPISKRTERLEKIEAKIKKVMATTVFGESIPIVFISATGEKTQNSQEPLGLDSLISVLRDNIQIPKRDASGPLYFAFDHSFAISGHGTILTGTILSGTLKVGQSISIPSIGAVSKIRSMQIFKKPVETAQKGDRVALSVTSVDPNELERGFLVDSKTTIPTNNGCIAVIQKIRFYKSKIKNSDRFHCTVGHITVMCTVQFFAWCGDNTKPDEVDENRNKSESSAIDQLSMGLLFSKTSIQWPKKFDFSQTYHHIEGLPLLPEHTVGSDFNLPQDELDLIENLPEKPKLFYAIIRFEKGIKYLPNSLIICTKLEDSAANTSCRIALFGQIIHSLTIDKITAQPPSNQHFYGYENFVDLDRISILKQKTKIGKIDRYLNSDNFSLIAKNFFKSDNHAQRFIGCNVIFKHESGTDGKSESPIIKGKVDRTFGKSGKCVVTFQNKLPEWDSLSQSVSLYLSYARNVLVKKGNIIQMV